MKDNDRHVEKEEKAEFRNKGGAAVGNKESVVEGNLDDMAGASKDSYNREDSPRDRLDRAQTRPGRP